MTVADTAHFIAAADKANITPLLIGPHGIGKSDSLKQYAESQGLLLEVLILSLMDTADLQGMPRTIMIGGQTSTIWAAPSWLNKIIEAAWPTSLKRDKLNFHEAEFEAYVDASVRVTADGRVGRDELNHAYCSYYNIPLIGLQIHTNIDKVDYLEGKRSLLGLDELNRATTDVLNASMQLLLDKKLNDHQLPRVLGKPTLIVAAINPSGDQYNTNELDPALLDRVIQGNVEADPISWLQWARANNVNSAVCAFIAKYPNKLSYTPAEGTVTATPRSWTALGRVVDSIREISPTLHFTLFQGLVGKELAAQFHAFYAGWNNSLTFEKVENTIIAALAKDKTISKAADIVRKLIVKEEAVQKRDMAEQFYTKYITSTEASKAAPLIVYLLAVDIEACLALLKSKKATDTDNFFLLVQFDATLTNKEVMKRAVDRPEPIPSIDSPILTAEIPLGMLPPL